MNINEEYLICPECGSEEYAVDWMRTTAMSICGEANENMVGNPLVDRSANFFYVCPHCEATINGNKFNIEADTSVRVTLAIDLDIEPGWSKERILKELHNYLVEVVDANNPPENVFHEIAIEGIDF